jgi:PiT family inorganic phosphate transporter
VSKGVATLVGCSRATYRSALWWGTACTAAGATTAAFVSAGLIEIFSTALVAAPAAELPQFPIAVAAGACAWVLLASVSGLPVSTTHALTGAIVGAGVAIGGTAGIRWTMLGSVVLLPLAFSPLVAALAARFMHVALRRPLERANQLCICVERGTLAIQSMPHGSAVAAVVLPVVRADRTEACDSAPAMRLIVANALHWITAGTLSFARALNDTPKIIAFAALAVAPLHVTGGTLFIAGAAMMAAGSLVGRRVTRTLAERVTTIDGTEGLASSATAAGLVLLASYVALPVSTTHVATGAIVGAGLSGGGKVIRWRAVGGIALAWLVTLPVSGIFAALTIWLLAV